MNRGKIAIVARKHNGMKSLGHNLDLNTSNESRDSAIGPVILCPGG